jgi:hypothetical protein
MAGSLKFESLLEKQSLSRSITLCQMITALLLFAVILASLLQECIPLLADRHTIIFYMGIHIMQA